MCHYEFKFLEILHRDPENTARIRSKVRLSIDARSITKYSRSKNDRQSFPDCLWKGHVESVYGAMASITVSTQLNRVKTSLENKANWPTHEYSHAFISSKTMHTWSSVHITSISFCDDSWPVDTATTNLNSKTKGANKRKHSYIDTQHLWKITFKMCSRAFLRDFALVPVELPPSGNLFTFTACQPCKISLVYKSSYIKVSVSKAFSSTHRTEIRYNFWHIMSDNVVQSGFET